MILSWNSSFHRLFEATLYSEKTNSKKALEIEIKIKFTYKLNCGVGILIICGPALCNYGIYLIFRKIFSMSLRKQSSKISN